MNKQELAAIIDHTQLKPFATKDMIEEACRVARDNHCAALAVNGCDVPLVAELLKGSGTKVCVGIGFPLGRVTTAVKEFEAKDAVKNGAEELDMLINIGKLKDGDTDYVLNEIRAVVNAAEGRTVKVIIETCYLTDEEKKTAAKLAAEAGADFVKTSTGLGTAGAVPSDVKLIRSVLPDNVRVKAAGGMKTLADVMANVEAGAERIGISATEDVLKEMDK